MRDTFSLRPKSKHGDDYETPRAFFALCSRIFGPFDLDVCARPETAKCERYYTAEDSCLHRDWQCRAAWCNPPYSENLISQIVPHAADQAQAGHCHVLALFPAKKSEYQWYADAVAMRASLVMPVRGRIAFLLRGRVMKQPNHASVLVWWRSGWAGPTFVCPFNNDIGLPLVCMHKMVEIGVLERVPPERDVRGALL